MAQHSPYTPGELATDVPGRESQLAAISERLAYMTGLRRLIGRIRLDQGPRGVGKTSLLAAAQRRAQQLGMLTIWVSAGTENPIIATLTAEIADVTQTWRRSDRQRLKKLTDRITLTVTAGVPQGVSVQAAVSPPTNEPNAGDVTTREFAALIESTSAAAIANDLRGVALFIDELQAADNAGLRVLAGAWQRLQRTAPNTPAAVFAAGLPNTRDVLRTAGGTTFAERFDYQEMPPLPPEAAQLALAAPATGLGVAWHPDALNAAVTLAAGYPYALQLIGDSIWKQAGYPNPRGVLSPQHLQAAVPQVHQAMTAVCESRWADATDTERAAMLVMATYGDRPITRQQLTAGLGGDRDVSDLRANLIRKGIVVPAGHGKMIFSAPGMAEYLRQHRSSHGDTSS